MAGYLQGEWASMEDLAGGCRMLEEVVKGCSAGVVGTAHTASVLRRFSGIEEYRAETEYCDVGSPMIQRLARELTHGMDSDRARAAAIYRWVQDHVRYEILHDWSKRASETLLSRVGTCTNKANLLVALLRAAGMPAGFHVMRVRGKYYFGPAWIPMLQQLCSDVTVHLFAAVYLDGRWVQCDPSCDRALAEGGEHINPPFRHVAFDGSAPAEPTIDPAHVLSVSPCMPSIDTIMAKRSSKPSVYFKIMNLFIAYVRAQGRNHDSCASLEPAFRQWLFFHHPQVYGEFLGHESKLMTTVAAVLPGLRGPGLRGVYQAQGTLGARNEAMASGPDARRAGSGSSSVLGAGEDFRGPPQRSREAAGRIAP